MDPIIVSVAPNGARKTTQDLPQIPVTPEALARTAKECADAGAALIHLHIRDREQKHTLDAGIYREATAAIREQTGDRIIVQVTSESVGIYQPEQQMAMVRAVRPEAASFAIRELIPDPSHEERAGAFFAEVLAMGTMPQYILYSPEEVRYFGQLRKRGVVPGRHVYVLFVLGKKHAAPGEKAAWSQPDDLDPFLETFDGVVVLSETHWGVCAFGGNENAVMRKVASCGGHVRIGFENNHFMEDGSIAPSNAALIRQFRGSLPHGRAVATAAAARKFLAATLQPKEEPVEKEFG